MRRLSVQNTSIAIGPSQEFADAIPMLYAPLESYVKGIIPLMLEHAWQLKKKSHSSAQDELANCAWIGRLITLDKRVQDSKKQKEIPGWIEIKNHLVKCMESCQCEAELSTMADACMEMVSPIIAHRFQKDYRFSLRPFYCWWYTVHNNNTNLALHLVNAYQPESPFDHLHHFLTTMLQAVEHAVSFYPTIQTVSCGSWLNGLPKFQELWPESFQHNQKILNETGGFGPGAWGQYMTTDGGFNEKKADDLRRTGRHPFALTEAQSPLDEVIAHLKRRIAETGE